MEKNIYIYITYSGWRWRISFLWVRWIWNLKSFWAWRSAFLVVYFGGFLWFFFFTWWRRILLPWFVVKTETLEKGPYCFFKEIAWIEEMIGNWRSTLLCRHLHLLLRLRLLLVWVEAASPNSLIASPLKWFCTSASSPFRST